jgi:helicase
VILYDWVSGHPIEDIERDHTTNPFSGRIEYSHIRGFADATRYLLRSASDILSLTIPGSYSADELDALLQRLEVGIPATAIELLELPFSLGRGEYLGLVREGSTDAQKFWQADDRTLEQVLGSRRFAEINPYRPNKVAEKAAAAAVAKATPPEIV